jgi:hypothetical protein
VGPLCVGKQVPGEEHDTGAMWECPFFVPLPSDASSGAVDSLLSLSDPVQYGIARPLLQRYTSCSVAHAFPRSKISSPCQEAGDVH